jgi:hypothetical protein
MSTSPFVFEIGADITKFTKSIGEVEAELKKFKTALKTDTGAAIIETNKQIKQLETSLVNLKKVGLGSTESFGKASTNALTSLSLAIQDVSFGFIGIQNNLPGVVQGFGQMSANAKTGASIMSQLGTALVGPAGIYLAFSAVTAIVTKLTMEYGSLGEVMNAIFGKTNALSGKIKELSESYEEFNKQLKTSQDIVGEEKASTSSQITEVQTLSKIILDQTKSYNERNAALNRLKEINKDYFGNLTLETLKTNTLTDAVKGYKDSLQQGAITKGFQEQVNKTNVELSKQQILLEKLQDATDAARRAPITISRVTGEQTNTQAIKDAESAYNAQLVVVNELKKRKAELNKEVINSVQAQIALRAPVDAATAALERQKKAEKESKVKIGTIIDSGELGPGRLVDTLEAFQAYVRGNINIQKNSIDKILTARLDYRRKELEENFLLPKKLDKNAGPLNKNPLIEYQFGQIKSIIDALKQEAKFIDDAFREPLENLFVDFLQKGKLSFEDFTKSVMRNITQLVAKLAASKLFEALANLIPQIAGTLVPGGTGLMELTNILGRGRNIFGAANLGGIGGGGMNLNGQVVFVQRGTDLVGVMNRTNAQIQRIG